jgi:hypothetical protein
MVGVQRTRSLLGPADPVGNAAVAPPRLSARDLIAHAEATTELTAHSRHARPTRRLVLVAGTVAAGATAVGYAIKRSTMDSPRIGSPPGANSGQFLLPIAYQFDASPPAAGAQLRALAGRLADAPYDNRAGRYTYHDITVWGDPVMSESNGRYVLGYASEQKIWQAADGTGRQISLQLEPQFPDQESRDYWSRKLPAAAVQAPNTTSLPPSDIAPLPSDRAHLADVLQVQYGAVAVPKALATMYACYAVPRQTRAEILRVLADVPGFLWRGEVTDRAGRKGLAITFDDREDAEQFLLIFDPNTGALLASEQLFTVGAKRIGMYEMILETERTDHLG